MIGPTGTWLVVSRWTQTRVLNRYKKRFTVGGEAGTSTFGPLGRVKAFEQHVPLLQCRNATTHHWSHYFQNVSGNPQIPRRVKANCQLANNPLATFPYLVFACRLGSPAAINISHFMVASSCALEADGMSSRICPCASPARMHGVGCPATFAFFVKLAALVGCMAIPSVCPWESQQIRGAPGFNHYVRLRLKPLAALPVLAKP